MSPTPKNSFEVPLGRTSSLRSALGIDADQDAGPSVAEPDCTLTDGQPAKSDLLWADLEGVHDPVAGRVDALQQPAAGEQTRSGTRSDR
jgi:hypothetical protein